MRDCFLIVLVSLFIFGEIFYVYIVVYLVFKMFFGFLEDIGLEWFMFLI